MLLECPNCTTEFKVRAEALGDVGRTVRCSRCAFEWFAEPRDLKERAAPVIEEPAFEEESALEEFSEDVLSALGSMDSAKVAEAALERRAERLRTAGPLPTSTAPSLLPAFLALAASVMLFAGGVVLYLQEPLRGIGLGGVYDALGMKESEGVKLANLSITKLDHVARTTYMLQGNVVNTAATEQPIPAVRIRLMSEDGETLREWEYEQPGTMKPQEVLRFSANKLDAAYKNEAHHFQVDIGSSYEMMMRN